MNNLNICRFSFVILDFFDILTSFEYYFAIKWGSRISFCLNGHLMCEFFQAYSKIYAYFVMYAVEKKNTHFTENLDFLSKFPDLCKKKLE